MALDIVADIVNGDCVHNRWLDALHPVLSSFVQTVNRIMNDRLSAYD